LLDIAVVLSPNATTIGTGGAVVALSDPAEEYEEMLLKARVVMQTVAGCVASLC
jgi:para-aminobenzoate synthetase